MNNTNIKKNVKNVKNNLNNSTNLNNMTKKELLNIISKMKKQELISIINFKNGGGKNSVRIPINPVNPNPNIPIIMANDEKYNKMYINQN